MSSPQYRQRIQSLADLVIATLPPSWRTATLRVSFPSEVRVDLQLGYGTSSDPTDTSADVPLALVRDLVGAARALRTELERGGNPACSGFVFHLGRDGKSSVDAEY